MANRKALHLWIWIEIYLVAEMKIPTWNKVQNTMDQYNSFSSDHHSEGRNKDNWREKKRTSFGVRWRGKIQDIYRKKPQTTSVIKQLPNGYQEEKKVPSAQTSYHDVFWLTIPYNPLRIHTWSLYHITYINFATVKKSVWFPDQLIEPHVCVFSEMEEVNVQKAYFGGLGLGLFLCLKRKQVTMQSTATY